MKKNLMLLVILFSLSSKAQNVQGLHLISGHPYSNTDEEFTSLLWSYSNGKLDTVSILSTRNDFLENVKVYPKEGLVTVHKTNSIRRKHLGDNHRLLLVSFQDIINFSEVEIETEGSFKYYLSQNGESILLDMFSKEAGKFFKEVNLRNLNISEVDAGDLVLGQVTGIPGGMIDAKDYMLVYSDQDSGLLRLAIVKNKNERPVIPFALSDNYWFESYSRHVISINNSNILVVHGKYEDPNKELTSSSLICLDKRDSLWHEFQIQGNIQKPRGFEEWIGGYVFNDHIDSKRLLGSEKWTKRASGLSPAERWGLNNNSSKYPYAPGILYLYNVFTSQYYEWDTREADSEVILVWDEKVIYRVYDELYQADIHQGEKLSLINTKLLIKEDVVPDIHWAFFRN